MTMYCQHQEHQQQQPYVDIINHSNHPATATAASDDDTIEKEVEEE